MKPIKVSQLILLAIAVCGSAVFVSMHRPAQAAGTVMAPGPMRLVAIYPDYCKMHDASKHTVSGELISNLDGVAFLATCNDGKTLEFHPGK